MKISEYDPDTHERPQAFAAGGYYDDQIDQAEQFEGAESIGETMVEGSVTGHYVLFAPVGIDVAEEMLRTSGCHIVRPEGSSDAEELAEKHGVFESDGDYEVLEEQWNERQ